MNLKTLPEEEKPRERLIKYGKENISTNELIEIILKSGTRNKGIKEISHNILSSVNNINELKTAEIRIYIMNYILAEISTLEKIEGMSKIKAIELIAAIELGRRVYEDNKYQNLVKLTSPATIIDYFHTEYKDKKQEIFTVLYLDNQKNYLDKKELFKGTVNYSLVHPREIFKNAYLNSASFIVCVHNHPSGDPTPSKEDELITNNLIEIGKLNNIPILDHIIIGDNNFFSFKKHNII